MIRPMKTHSEVVGDCDDSTKLEVDVLVSHRVVDVLKFLQQKEISSVMLALMASLLRINLRRQRNQRLFF